MARPRGTAPGRRASLRGDQIARMEARRQISQAQFAAGRHYQGLHEIAFARALHSLDLAAPVIDKNRYGLEPFSDRQRMAIHRLRVIDGSIVLRHGIDVLVLMHAVLLGGRSVVEASRTLPRAKASYWRTAFRLALDEIAAFAGLATKPTRPPVPERYALPPSAYPRRHSHPDCRSPLILIVARQHRNLEESRQVRLSRRAQP